MDDTEKQQAKHLDKFKWTKGTSGNPAGRPKKEYSLTSELKRRLDDPKLVRELVLAWIQMVKSGNFQALAEMLNRLEGKVAEKHELDSKVPVTLVFQPVIARPELPEGQVIEGQAVEISDTV